MTSLREKMEIELSEHIKKAILPTETSPKQKHIRCKSFLFLKINIKCRVYFIYLGKKIMTRFLELLEVAAIYNSRNWCL